MFICPNCNTDLARVRNENGLFWRCASCGGQAMSLPLLRKSVVRHQVNEMWNAARESRASSSRACPACARRMVQVAVSSASGAPQLDVCTTCEFVWFDPSEFESLSAKPRAHRPEDGLSPEARRALAIAQAEQQASQMSRDNPPTEMWQLVPALLGLPVEEEYDALQRAPWLTWLLIGAIGLIGVLALGRFPRAIENFGLIPAFPLRYGGLTFLTSIFLHAGVLQWATNMYFLFIFGDNVEDYLGKARYALLFLLAGMAGGFMHLVLEPHSTAPCVGASGAIFGIVVFYALRFPHAQLGFFARWLFIFRWVRMPAYMFLGFWLLAEIVGAWQQVAGFTLAHLGGAAVGFLFWLKWRNI